jgi:hypothetical protein
LEVPDLGLSPVTDGGMLQSRPDAGQRSSSGRCQKRAAAPLRNALTVAAPCTKESRRSSGTTRRSLAKEAKDEDFFTGEQCGSYWTSDIFREHNVMDATTVFTFFYECRAGVSWRQPELPQTTADAENAT